MRKKQDLTPAPPDDPNIMAAGLLYDLALLQPAERSRFGYIRAAKTIATGIESSVRDLVGQGTLRDVPFVGPSSARIVTEFVETGHSSTVRDRLAASPARGEVERRRAFRRAYLSRHAMRAALAATAAPHVIGRETYCGDLQMHSTWSDGGEPIARLAEAALALGYSRLGVTDHSHGLRIARGMSMADAARQRREIDDLNARLAGRLRVYQGIEANILADGDLDLSLDERRAFSYVLASPHSLLRKTHDQTARMLEAVRQPGVAILGHPQGRIFNTRPGVHADWRQVFREAAAHEVAIEIDGSWHRQDVDLDLAAMALEEGCLFALDSDAHSLAELAVTDYALAHARLAGVPADRVVNAWSTARFDAWIRRRHAGSPPRKRRARA